MKTISTYIKSIFVPIIIGGIVGIIISKFMDYSFLNLPPLAPPTILFPIVWTILYLLMGISYGILKNNNLVDNKIKWIYFIQLGINALWPIFFFVLKWRLFAFVWILLLVIAIVSMIVQFYEKNKYAGILQIPYLFWTLFASYLNLSIYLMN